MMWRGGLNIKGLNLIDRHLDLTNYDIVRNLIFKKNEILSFMDSHESNFLSHESRPLDLSVREYILDIYSSLDYYIKICEFNKESSEIIRLLTNGMSIEDVSKTTKLETRTIFNRVRRIVLKINLIAEIERCSENESTTTKWW